MNMRVLSDKDVIRVLDAEVKRAGGQAAWSRQTGIDRTEVNKVLNGQRPPSKKMINALKLQRVYVFRAHLAK
jgi:DNA-binding phage protein